MNKTDRHDINEILLKVVLNTLTLTLTLVWVNVIISKFIDSKRHSNVKLIKKTRYW